jgi:4-amino-4-deoxy-L-arabinose transferase-like glycosyltransferase
MVTGQEHDGLSTSSLGQPRRGAARIVLMGILALGLLARGLWAVWHTGAIELEGAEYARIAQNVRDGMGYVGIATAGPEVMFPPLYPLLIAGVSFITGDYEWAARLISIVAGATLPLLVFGIVSRLFGRRTALVAALLTCVHPFLVALSATTDSESLYFTLLLSGIYLVLRGLDRPSLRVWCLVGGVLALAYLTRPEALVILAIAVAVRVIAPGGTLRRRIGWGLGAVAVFLLLVTPYSVFLYRATGHLRIEGKSLVHLAYGRRLAAGQSEDESQYSVNERLEGTGIWMRPVVELLPEAQLKPRAIAAIIVKDVRRNAPMLLGRLSSPWVGGPLMFALAIMGLFRRPWRRDDALSHLLVALAAVGCLVGPLSTPYHNERYTFVLVPFLLIWGSEGIVQVFRWTEETADGIVSGGLRRRICGIALSGLLVVVVLVSSLRDVPNLFPGPDSRVVEDVAAWLRGQQDRPVTIMDITARLAFHAGGQWIHPPYASGDVALRFLDAARVDYVVLHRKDGWLDYYRDWYEHGIPSSRAELVRASSDSYNGEWRIFRWHRTDVQH